MLSGPMLEGRPPERGPISVPLNLEDKGVASLSPFQRAAFLLYCSHLQEIDKLTRDLFETVADIRNFSRAKVDPTDETVPLLPSALDPERLASIARWFTSLWLAWLIAIYVPDIPNTVTFIVLTNSLSMALSVMPQLRIARLLLPVAFGLTLGGAIYVLVMPHLASFASLGTVLFAAVFLICCLYHRPTQAAGKMLALATPWWSRWSLPCWRSRHISPCHSAPSTCSSACSAASFARAPISPRRWSGIPPAR